MSGLGLTAAVGVLAGLCVGAAAIGVFGTTDADDPSIWKTLQQAAVPQNYNRPRPPLPKKLQASRKLTKRHAGGSTTIRVPIPRFVRVQITNQSNMLLNGTAEPGSVLQLRVDGRTIANTAVSRAGQWALKIDHTFRAGDHRITATSSNLGTGQKKTSEEVRVAIPAGFYDGSATVQSIELGNDDNTLIDAETRDRAEELAEIAHRRFSQLTEDADTEADEPSAVDETPIGDTGKSKPGRRFQVIEYVEQWIDHSANEYQQVIVRKLSVPTDHGQDVDPAAADPNDDSTTPQPDVKIAATEPDTGSEVEDTTRSEPIAGQGVQDWFERANRVYQDEVVKELSVGRAQTPPLEKTDPPEEEDTADELRQQRWTDLRDRLARKRDVAQRQRAEADRQAAFKRAEAQREAERLAAEQERERQEQARLAEEEERKRQEEERRAAQKEEQRRVALQQDQSRSLQSLEDKVKNWFKNLRLRARPKTVPSDKLARADRVHNYHDEARFNEEVANEAETDRVVVVPVRKVESWTPRKKPTVRWITDYGRSRYAERVSRRRERGQARHVPYQEQQVAVASRKDRYRKSRRKVRGYRRRVRVDTGICTARCKNAGRRTRRGYIVKCGDTLSGIAERYYGSARRYYRIYRANRRRLRSPHRIYPCQRLVLPRRGRRR